MEQNKMQIRSTKHKILSKEIVGQ